MLKPDHPDNCLMAGIKLAQKRLQLFLACCLLWSEGAAIRPQGALAGQQPLGKAVPEAPFFLHLSDVHLNTASQTTAYGEDTGIALWRATRLKLQSLLSSTRPPRFVIYTGDLPAHYPCANSCYLPPDKRASHNANLRAILADLRGLVAKSRTPLFVVPGNNDGLAGDYTSFADSAQATPFSLVPKAGNPYPALNVAPRCGISPCLLAAPHPRMGYYAASPIKGLRLIGLNTIIWGTSYLPVDGVSQLEAGQAQMAWLVEQLKAAKVAGDKIYILMHIPPGVDAYSASQGKTPASMWAQLPATGPDWQDQFLKIVNDNSANVAGLLYGHTHMDELRLIYDRSGANAREVAISSPGVTPQHHNNPGFKAFYYHPNSMELTDFVTYYTRPDATTWGDATYRFSQVYGCGSQAILACLEKLPLSQVGALMNTVFTVQNGAPTYATEAGIPVKFRQ
jgi:hypothetical protein